MINCGDSQLAIAASSFGSWTVRDGFIAFKNFTRLQPTPIVHSIHTSEEGRTEKVQRSCAVSARIKLGSDPPSHASLLFCLGHLVAVTPACKIRLLVATRLHQKRDLRAIRTAQAIRRGAYSGVISWSIEGPRPQPTPTFQVAVPGRL